MPVFNGRNWTLADFLPFKFIENWDAFWSDVIAEMTARVQGVGNALKATSNTSSVAIGVGSKSLTVETGKGFSANLWVVASDAANSANSMTGSVTSYNASTGVLVLSVPAGGTTGGGMPTSWIVGISGAIGPAGPAFTSGSLAGAINEAAVTLASASTVNIGAAAGNYLTITGATTVTAFDVAQAGTERVLRFATALTLTHNATSLILPTGASISTAAGDIAVMRSEGAGNWRCVSYTRATGLPLAGVGIAVQDEGSAVLASAATLNFIGPSVTVSNVGGVATVTIANTVLADGAEDGSTIGWAAEANASLVNSAAQAASGTRSWLYSCSAASNYFVSKQIPNLVNGTTYTVTFWAKMTSGSGARTVMIRPTSFAGAAAYSSTFTFSSAWTQYTFTFVAVATSMYWHLGNDPGTACTIYIDDIVVRS